MVTSDDPTRNQSPKSYLAGSRSGDGDVLVVPGEWSTWSTPPFHHQGLQKTRDHETRRNAAGRDQRCGQQRCHFADGGTPLPPPTSFLSHCLDRPSLAHVGHELSQTSWSVLAQASTTASRISSSFIKLLSSLCASSTLSRPLLTTTWIRLFLRWWK